MCIRDSLFFFVLSCFSVVWLGRLYISISLTGLSVCLSVRLSVWAAVFWFDTFFFLLLLLLFLAFWATGLSSPQSSLKKTGTEEKIEEEKQVELLLLLQDSCCLHTAVAAIWWLRLREMCCCKSITVTRINSEDFFCWKRLAALLVQRES